MTLSRAKYYFVILSQNIFSSKGLTIILSSFGALWLCVEITNFFFRDTSIPIFLQSHWWVFFIFGIIIAILNCWPTLQVAAKLKDRDIDIEIVIGDVFSFEGAIVVGSNTTFDTRISLELISEKSVQGQFTRQYYDSESTLDMELNIGLNGLMFETLNGVRAGKTNRYPLGTVVRVNPRGRTGFFAAIGHTNEHGAASGSFEDLKKSLGALWLFIGERGPKGNLVVPVLGTGFSRITHPRQVIVQEIIKSFIAACSETTFCDKITIVISEIDAVKHNIHLDILGKYLEHVCTYTQLSSNTDENFGTPIDL